MIEARDQGSPALTGTTTATVTITDVNDNSPLFTNTPFEFSVDEHAANDTVVGTVTAVDYDIGEYCTQLLKVYVTEILLISTESEY